MINFLRNALSTDYAIRVATQIAERQSSLTLSELVIRLSKFLGVGAIALTVAIAMYLLADSGSIEQPHTQRLTAFVGFSSALVSVFALFGSFSLLWDAIISQYTRRIAAENALVEEAFDDHAAGTHEVEILEQEPFTDDGPPDETGDLIGQPVYVRVSAVRLPRVTAEAMGRPWTGLGTPRTGIQAHFRRKLFIRHRDGTIASHHMDRPALMVDLNVPVFGDEQFSEEEFNGLIQGFVTSLTSRSDIGAFSTDEERQIAETVIKIRETEQAIPGSTGVLIKSILGEGGTPVRGTSGFRRRAAH